MQNPGTILTNREKNLCEYGGAFGVLLTLTCLIQHLIFVIPMPVTNSIIPAYVFAVAAFFLLAIKKSISMILLIISAILCCIVEYLWVKHYSFSLAVILLFVYHVIIIVALFVEEVPKKLKMKRAAEKAEEDLWAGKI